MEDKLAKRTWVEINPEALKKNLHVCRELAPDAAVMAVVKADAYGHGLTETVKAIESQIDAFGVATLREAITIISLISEKKMVMILGALLPDERKAAILQDIHVTVSSLEEAKEFSDLGKSCDREVQAHLVLDTGMGRLGFSEKSFVENCQEIKTLNHISIKGVATHFPCSDQDNEFTEKQIKAFNSILRNSNIKPKWIHLANSAATLRIGNSSGTMIRPGLIIYGISPIEDSGSKLKPAMEWRARISQIRNLPPGSSISYGRSYITEAETKVATVAVGYGDGYPRSLSGKDTEVIIKGTRCRILGKVTMDMIMVDVTTICEPLKSGDEVTLIGTEGNECISVLELAKKAETIPWEILTGISPRVERMICEENKE